MVASLPAGATSGEEGQTWPSFNESSGCGYPRTIPPLASRTGALPDSERIAGPFGDFFGRTVGQVRSSLVPWVVPMSGGRVAWVHVRLLPAFQKVSANLAAAEAAGLYYPVRSATAFVPRTISGRLRFSYHAFGAAIDINPAANPYRSDTTLITDMPAWYVKAWTDAGFCWGGDWVEKKDPMHFSWQGPLPSGYLAAPAPLPSYSFAAPFTQQAMSGSSVFGAPRPGSHYLLADASGDGAADLVQVSPHPNGALVEYLPASSGFAECTRRQDLALGAEVEGRNVLLGDADGSGRLDLWVVDDSSGTVALSVYLHASDFRTVRGIPTGAPAADDYLLADHDGDHILDLYALTRTPDTTHLAVWQGPGFVAPLLDGPTALSAPGGERHYTSIDRNHDGVPDLVAVEQGASGTTLAITSGAASHQTLLEQVTLPLGSVATAAMRDYDGDGRRDLWVLGDDGQVTVLLGNTPVSLAPSAWFADPEWECPSEWFPYHYQGAFRDDEASPHQADINALAAAGITRGCNPPFNDRYCPRQPVTREQMATFLVRALQLPPAELDAFGDDNASPHQADINALAAAGITTGCGPGAYCPARLLTRAEAASLLVRALQLPPAELDAFADDNASPHQADINALAAAGITTGCGPAAYCPAGALSREEMASLLARALAGLDSPNAAP